MSRGGAVLAVVGPDGTGKSTLCALLIERSLIGAPVMHVHHRFRLLPGGRAVPTTEPHADPPYGRLACELKAVYLFVDYLLGWLLRARPFLRRGGWILMERAWWDLVVDPARYRMRPNTVLVPILGRLLPAPDAHLVLDCPPEAVLARKGELPAAELTRQTEAWRRFVARNPKAISIDASLPVEAVLERAVAEVDRIRADRGARA